MSWLAIPAIFAGWLAWSRYWNSIPLIGTTVYDPPADLKYVRVK